MKKVKVEEALGMKLCHDITAMREGFKGAAFKRGHVIREEDIPLLLNIGKRHVYIWEDTAGEIHEEEAAKRMAEMIGLENAHYGPPKEGKIVLTSGISGLYRVNTKLLKKINSIEDITIATLPDHYPVKKGTKVASMRIIPLVTKEENILAAEKLCRKERLLKILPYRQRRIGVIITGSEIYTGRIEDRFEPVVRSKVLQYPADIIGVSVCDDDIAMIDEQAKELLKRGADLLIFAGGMSVDPDDVTPAAIEALGADIISYGVPAQPGNMTLAAYLGDTAILGVPGAAISLPTTMFDVLLPQMFTDEKLTREDLVRLGEGGLCQRCRRCHFPNCTFGRY
ncbi:MAG: molybdopterin-binding protein [Lachnospiraceae bacterium]|nr:molybdopterin-binding protein [Lachnospiraceae bacterium]